MNEQNYVIAGATGHVGGALAETLLAKGKKVRVIGRSDERLKPFVQKGAELLVGSLDDAEFLTRAFVGAKAIFAMIPPLYTAADYPSRTAAEYRTFQNKISEALAVAAERARVSHVVTLSSNGAHLPDKTGPIAGLYDNEQRFDKLGGANVIHLRAGFFMENFFFNLPLIKNSGINGTPIDPNLALPMIATKDIAAEAARLLEELNFNGKSFKELHGNQDLTMTEATRILGKAIGKPDLPYVQFPYEDARQAMLGMGLTPGVVEVYIEMYRGFNDGYIKFTENRSPRNTTPTSLEEFAEQVFAPAYHSSETAAA